MSHQKDEVAQVAGEVIETIGILLQSCSLPVKPETTRVQKVSTESGESEITREYWSINAAA